ncbi:methyltransferase domain-containing protein [Nostoc sp. CCCryo 231-06]|nr:methyltransferase domain-containing protein [Nostoc sp. CCCryo 231-06]
MGSIGNSTLPYVDGFPDAEVHAIDVGAPMLRYAHARAESLGKRVHFSQQNAEQTNFPDESFDLGRVITFCCMKFPRQPSVKLCKNLIVYWLLVA